MEAKTNVYEGMFLLGPIGTTDLDAGLNLCRKFIEAHGGQISVLKKWDERKLMYEIQGQKRGTYVISYFRAGGGAIAQIERDVKLNEEVLRVMITRADHLNETEMAAVEPQPIQPREERPADRWNAPMGLSVGGGDRGDRGDRDRGDRGDRPSRPRRDEGGVDTMDA